MTQNRPLQPSSSNAERHLAWFCFLCSILLSKGNFCSPAIAPRCFSPHHHPGRRLQVAGRACSRIKVVLRCLHPPIHPPNGRAQLLSLDRPCCRSRLEPTQEKYRVQTNSQLKLQAAQPRAGQGRAVHASPCQSMPVHASPQFFFLGPNIHKLDGAKFSAHQHRPIH